MTEILDMAEMPAIKPKEHRNTADVKVDMAEVRSSMATEHQSIDAGIISDDDRLNNLIANIESGLGKQISDEGEILLQTSAKLGGSALTDNENVHKYTF